MGVYLSYELLFLVQHELREEVIEKVKWNISRDSPEDKLRDLLEWMKAVKRDTVHSVSSSIPSSPILSTCILSVIRKSYHGYLTFFTGKVAEVYTN